MRFATRRSPTRDALPLAKFITKSASNAASVDKRSRGNSSKEAGNLTALNVTRYVSWMSVSHGTQSFTYCVYSGMMHFKGSLRGSPILAHTLEISLPLTCVPIIFYV